MTPKPVDLNVGRPEARAIAQNTGPTGSGLLRLMVRVVAGFLLAAALLPVLVSEPRPLAEQPWSDSAEYADAAHHLVTGQGYVTRVHELEPPERWDYRVGPQPPRYPPGTSLALLPFVAVGGGAEHANVGAKAYAALLVALAGVVAWSLGGPFSGALAAWLVGSSPFAYASATIVLSDGLAALLTILVLGGVLTGRTTAAGVIAGLSVLVRSSNVVLVLALLFAAPAAARWRVLAASMVGVIALLGHQWLAFGNPLSSGYTYWLPELLPFSFKFAFHPTWWRTPLEMAFAAGDGPWIVPDRLQGSLMDWACNGCEPGGSQRWLPNIVSYPATVLGLFWTLAPPLLPVLGLAWCWRRRAQPAERFTLAALGLTLAVYTFYFYQGARFMAPVGVLLLIYSSVGLTSGMARLFSKMRGRGYGRRGTSPQTPGPRPIGTTEPES